MTCPGRYGGTAALAEDMLSFRTRIFGGMLAVALVSIGVAVFYGKAWFEKVQLEAA